MNGTTSRPDPKITGSDTVCLEKRIDKPADICEGRPLQISPNSRGKAAVERIWDVNGNKRRAESDRINTGGTVFISGNAGKGLKGTRRTDLLSSRLAVAGGAQVMLMALAMVLERSSVSGSLLVRSGGSSSVHKRIIYSCVVPNVTLGRGVGLIPAGRGS